MNDIPKSQLSTSSPTSPAAVQLLGLPGGKEMDFAKGIGSRIAMIDQFWSNYSDLTRPGPPNGGFVREISLFQKNLGW